MLAKDRENFIEEQYHNVKWSNAEAAIKCGRDHKKEIFFRSSIPFKGGLVRALRKSVFGPFLEELNPNQNNLISNENKFSIIDYEIKKMNQYTFEHWKTKNQIFDNMYGHLKDMVVRDVNINVENLKPVLKVLRICDGYTNFIDKELKSFKHLQVLVMSGNNIRDINGSHLPRNLRFLELNNNFLSDLKNFAKNAPKLILHLGLGRNCLNDNSSLHLLREADSFQKLRSLDLSDNDICDLNGALNVVRDLGYLRSLHLEGNPCYLNPFYINHVAAALEELTFLDGTEILLDDRHKKPVLEEHTKPEFTFYCYRLMGLPKPPTQKNAKFKQTIHIEFSIPLLETPKKVKPKPIVEKIESITVESEKPAKLRVKSKSKIGLVKSKSHTSKSKGNLLKNTPSRLRKSKQAVLKPERPLNIYEQRNEFDEKFEASNTAFKSTKQSWSQIIEFPHIAIKIPDDLVLLRDSLRSSVKIDIVYLLVAPSGAFKPDVRADVSSRAGVRLDTDKSKYTENTPEELKDEILAKIVLASFNCDLETWNWSDQRLDFYWIDHPDIGYSAVKVNGTLKDLNYTGKKTDDHENPPQTVPKILTCHVGFEMTRDLFCVTHAHSPVGASMSKFQRSIHNNPSIL